MKKILFLIFVVSIFAACGGEAITEIPTVSEPPAVSENKFKEISPAEARTAVEKPDAQFIDVRTADEYKAGHAPNALNFPLDALSAELGKLDQSKPVYVICQSGKRSAQGAKILNEAGFSQVFSIKGGTNAWVSAELPIEKVADEKKARLDEKTEKALLAALADERRAQATYEAVLEKFPDARPFSNIVNAEKRHESFLLPLFEKYSVKVPENEFTKEKAQVPATVADACQSAVAGEKENIALYDGFLEFVKEQDIRKVFIHLRDASKNNHLPAFERCGGEGERGIGRGRGK